MVVRNSRRNNPGVRALIRGAVVALACMALAAPAREPVAVVTGNGYGPFADSDLPNGGLATELVRRVFAEMDRPAEIAFEPWRRGYNKTLKGRYRATFPYIRMPERTEEFYYSDPLFTVQLRVFVHADRPFEELDDLSGKTLCVPLGYAITMDVRRLLDDLNYDQGEPRSMAQCFRMLESGRVDFVVITRRHAQAVIDELPLDWEAVRYLDDVDVSSELHLIVPRDLDDARALLDSFNAALARLRERGEVKPIGRHYLND